MRLSPHLYSLVLVNAQAVHQTKDLFTVLPHAHLPVRRHRLLVQNGPLHRDVQRHPLMLLDLGHGQALGRVQDQHPADQVFTV